MKRTPLPPGQAVAPNTMSDFDIEDFKDVYPEPLPGEPPAQFFLRHVFACDGYETLRIETAITHPVMIIHVACTSAPQITDQRLILRRFQSLLRRAGFQLRCSEMMVTRTGPRISITFLWWNSPLDYAAMLRQADEDAKQFADMAL